MPGAGRSRRAHHRRHRPGPHHRRRLSVQRRRRAARVAGQLHRHRPAERQPLRPPRGQDQRVRAAQGVQRKHRRIHQRRHSRHRPRRPHRELERADGGHVRTQPRRGLGQSAGNVFPPEFIAAPSTVSATSPACITSTSSRSPRALASSARPTSPSRPLLSRDFVAVGRIVLVDDITERVSLETQLAQADKLSSIGLLAAGVAHEINTPLAVISSYSQMLAKQLRGDARLGPVLEKITQQSFRAAEIANGLLNFSRTSTTEFRETDLNQVIRDTLSLLEHQFKTAQILVDARRWPEDLPAHPRQSRQAAAGVSQSAAERQGGHARRRPPARGHPGQWPCGGHGGRLRHRHRRRRT